MEKLNDFSAFWMPFTANRHFKSNPRLLVAAKDMFYQTHDGRKILDGTAGLWCCNAGHNRQPIVEAIQHQAATLDYAPSFQMGHPLAFELANRLVDLAPKGMFQVFFTNSGSESVDTALKIALAYHQAKGKGGKTRLIGRERGYHGVGFGGTSVGGMVANRKSFGNLLGGVDHLRHTHDLAKNAFTRGLPSAGAELAEDLSRLIALHDASTIAAVIIEPVAGSTGVLLPPKGYLKRLREICDHHDILLIFDEVISGYGRLGTAFAAEEFDVIPDMIVTAKGLTSGTVPMGAVIVKEQIYAAFMQGPAHMIELFHGYTYSAHPLACAAALATLALYKQEGLFERVRQIAPYWEAALHGLKDCPHVIDIRNYGLIGAVELAPRPNSPTARAFDAFLACYEKGVLIRTTGDIIALSPPFILEKSHIDTIFDTLRAVLKSLQ